MRAPPILLQTDRYVVLDKPAGLPVHPGPRGGASVEDWFPQLSRRKDGPWLAHRLDADTAGCLVVALRRAALHAAQACFAGGYAGKTYWAVVKGVPDAPEGQVSLPLRRHSTVQGWRILGDPGGTHADSRPAVTDWRLCGSDGQLSWLELHPRTGRTHQIRVHCAALGCALLGDPVYGKARDDGSQRLHLLARAIMLPLAPPLHAEAAPPPHMHAALSRCGWRPATTMTDRWHPPA